MSAPQTKRTDFSSAGIGVIDLTTGQIRRDAYLYDNKEMIIQGITGVVRSYYFSFDSIPEYSEHTKSMTLLNEKIQAYAREKIQLEHEAEEARRELEALGEEPKPQERGKDLWFWILLLVLLLAYWIYAAVLSGQIAFDPNVKPVTGIGAIDGIFAALPSFLVFPQAVYSQAGGMTIVTNSLSSPLMMVLMLILPLILILGLIIRTLRANSAKRAFEEAQKNWRERRKALEDKLSGIEQKILKDTNDTASVSDELNTTESGFLNAQLPQYHKLTERYNSLLKFRSLIPEQYHTPAALAELVKVVTTMGAETWGAALELADIRMMGGDHIPLTQELYAQIARYFHNDKCILHLLSISENDVKLEAMAETWKTNQEKNAEYLSYEKTLQAKAAREQE